MSASVLSLPISLILLVHLHILGYAQANRPEYDHNIFDPRVRGLRERTKLLEDISYFLVERLEGNSKTILSTYPCLQPSDTVAFRTSLAKYLEALRHQSLYPHSSLIGTIGRSKGKEVGTNNKSVAWWWKDVMVRKSLLEECSGQKFERLLLALSTHTLLNRTSSELTETLEKDINTFLHTQPTIYRDLLTKYQSTRHSWSHSASSLLKRQEDIELLRKHITSHTGVISSKYSSLSTQRLVALRDSKHRDLLQLWHGRDGNLGLELLTELAGLKAQALTSDHPRTTVLTAGTADSKPQIIPLTPLPIAAAHHPANLKKIRKPIFPSIRIKVHPNAQTAESQLEQWTPVRCHARISLSDRLDSERRIRQALTDALARTRKVGQDLALRMAALEIKWIGKTSAPRQALDLWNPSDKAQIQPIRLSTQPTPELLASLSLHPPEDALEARIDQIRESILPGYPSLPDLSAPRLPAMDTITLSSTTTNAPLYLPTTKVPHINPKTKVELSSSNRHKRPSPPPHTAGPQNSRQPWTSTLSETMESRPVRSHSILRGQAEGERRPSRAPRKSIRFSLAMARRPSLFPKESDLEGDEIEDEVSRIVDSAQDKSTEDPLGLMTPRTKPANRIPTGTKASTIKRPKLSYPVVFEEPPVSLPSLTSSASSFDDLPQDATWTPVGKPDSRSPPPAPKQIERLQNGSDTDSADGYQNEASMTLRDILLRADTTHFELLDDEQEEFAEESFDWE